ncbi:unnamed protein product, partial [Protopolystoma xenopodis]
MELGAHYAGRNFPKRRTRLHGESRAGERAHSAVRAELLGGEETVRLLGLARLLTLKGEEEEEKTETKSEVEDLLPPHQDSEEAVY